MNKTIDDIILIKRPIAGLMFLTIEGPELSINHSICIEDFISEDEKDKFHTKGIKRYKLIEVE